jgi:hypothetical protein
MKYASHNSFGIKKALLLGIDCIVNTNYKGQEAKLFNDYTRELEETKIWLEGKRRKKERSLNFIKANQTF